jgi:hypothetical protein
MVREQTNIFTCSSYFICINSIVHNTIYCSILLHCVNLILCFTSTIHVQLRLAFILLFIVNYTTCFGLNGHHQVHRLCSQGHTLLLFYCNCLRLIFTLVWCCCLHKFNLWFCQYFFSFVCVQEVCYHSNIKN